MHILWLAVLPLALFAGSPAVKRKAPASIPQTVVFVCEHGNVKSLIAREWFNRRATERGLALRAESRGLVPEGPAPRKVQDALSREGFDVSLFAARPLTVEDRAGALRVVAIGVDPVPTEGSAPIERWDGIPPASQDYAASRDALKARVEILLDELTRGRPDPAPER